MMKAKVAALRASPPSGNGPHPDVFSMPVSDAAAVGLEVCLNMGLKCWPYFSVRAEL